MITKYLIALLLISVIGVGVFGFASMNHTSSHDTGCVTSVMEIPCPENSIAMLAHHIQAYVSFFSVILATPFAFFTALFLALFLYAKTLFYKQRAYQNFDYGSKVTCPIRGLAVFPLKEIIRWLSLFENSPSLHRIPITIFKFTHLCKQKSLKIIKTINSLIRLWQLIWSAEWSLLRRI
ncbi:MAG: hypothetical protein A2836_03190 [Candidatus Taylorbacteria bacterium RIFCSPHIGHO2_01_FULL_45_63]|uniref:Uncharacterized protein n=1 Tax=Candidatus Taylorbacteria bacterium RIFCSPHIGHO2_02_FULL_45_35 TaxID=1802311 RepID=A0A1G2MTX3_9BACT|nr:MAG: hypothetical protein A2836_03190 [Candidatus Taylorbacteria bacterium RIFCSPHIGHO2_01_FULL_45_63]OHA27317.1 MAG: hypothetical protein A3D56_01185 [Candidatus Taylorbacteria bacterium RIFCSPHIGHO2_02_FULL_45_35]OHA34632.1 MAG: hypothetical protein A3A22_02140 [Candidatus Taylorbacteria bacterium RIFCSPLOWO2_01_FULL_45_34b]